VKYTHGQRLAERWQSGSTGRALTTPFNTLPLIGLDRDFIPNRPNYDTQPSNTTTMANSTDIEPTNPPKKPRLSKTALNAAIAASSLACPPKPIEVFRTQYKPLRWIVTSVELDFELYDGYTIVHSALTVDTNPQCNGDNDTNEGLIFNGDETCVQLQTLSINNIDLSPDSYEFIPGKLIIDASKLTSDAVVRMTVRIVPEENTQLSGLYRSGSIYCTQCEAEGFRRSECALCFFLDTLCVF